MKYVWYAFVLFILAHFSVLIALGVGLMLWYFEALERRSW